jgi:peptide/nickel transport system substrate-binding protein
MNARHTLRNRWAARAVAGALLGLLLAWAPTVLAGIPRAASTPKPGGSITERLDGSPDCLDMYKTADGYSYDMNYPVIDSLLSLNENSKPVPYLAQKYKVSKDGKTLTFTLHQGLKFSNGDSLTAATVKTDFERALDPATKSPFSANLLSSVKSITTTGKYIVTLHLSAPNRPLLGNLAGPYLGIMDPKSVTAAGTNTCNGLVGSGPFKFASIGPSYSSVKEVRNPNHTFGPSWAHNKGPAYLSSVTFEPIQSDTTAVSELLAGQLDITDVPASELGRVKGNANITIHNVPQQADAFLEFNSGRAPFNNVAVRRAVAEAIDRKAVVTAALQGLGKVSTSILPPTILDYDPGSTKYAPKLNLTAARNAIAAAHATGPYTLLTTNVLGLDAAAELIQGELAQVGMTVNASPSPCPTGSLSSARRTSTWESSSTGGAIRTSSIAFSTPPRETVG